MSSLFSYKTRDGFRLFYFKITYFWECWHSPISGKRVNIYKGSQTDPKVLNKIIKEQKKFDYIIDDGSHINKDVIFTFEYMFKSLKEGGYYFVEDTLTSYLRDYGGEGAYLKKNNTIINYFKNIVDKINYKEIEKVSKI